MRAYGEVALKRCLVAAMAWLSVLIVLPALLAGCINIDGGPRPAFDEVLLLGEGNAKILMIDINGTIHNEPLIVPGMGIIPGMTARIRQELEIAYRDPSIRAVLLRINSPGGTLTDSDVIYHSLLEFKKSKKVKIIATMGDITASGGVYVAMAADEIYAHPTTITGSIGVIMPHINLSGLMEKLGIETDSVASGEYKDFDNPLRPRKAKERELIQALINHQHEKFVRVIKAGRPRMSLEKIREIADGRIFSAEQAKELGLIDEIGYLDDAYNRLSVLTGVPRNRLVRYANAFLTGNNIYSNTFPVELNDK